MTTSLVLKTDHDPDPAYVTELGDGLPELVRVLNHQTLQPEALDTPADIDRLARNLALTAQRLPQLIEQMKGRLTAMQATGRLRAAGGRYTGEPDMAADIAGIYLDQAAADAGKLLGSLEDAARETAHLGWQDEGEEG